jgi:hypothetical protein
VSIGSWDNMSSSGKRPVSLTWGSTDCGFI